MEYFWYQQDDIPSDMGYPLFGKEHIISTCVTLAAVVLLAVLFRRAEDKIQRRVLKGIPVLMILLEVWKDLFLVSMQKFGVGYLPLHICSIGIFVFLLRELLPSDAWKAFFGEVSVILIMPSALTALIFPDWTVLYPMLNFFNLHSFLWHGLLVLYPVLLLICGEVRPSLKHIWYEILFLCVVVPPIYVFDKHFHCNYFFVNRPEPGTPLEWMAGFLGNPGYLIAYAFLAIAVMLLVYGVLYLVMRFRKDSGRPE